MRRQTCGSSSDILREGGINIKCVNAVQTHLFVLNDVWSFVQIDFNDCVVARDTRVRKCNITSGLMRLRDNHTLIDGTMHTSKLQYTQMREVSNTRLGSNCVLPIIQREYRLRVISFNRIPCNFNDDQFSDLLRKCMSVRILFGTKGKAQRVSFQTCSSPSSSSSSSPPKPWISWVAMKKNKNQKFFKIDSPK